jgi:hypothetical protein
MAISSFSSIGKALADEGRFHFEYVYKPTQPIPGTAGFFVDLNQTSGKPKYNAFAGNQLSLNVLSGVGNDGVYTGPFISGREKYLIRWQVLNINTAANTIPPDHIFLLDYLGFYPLIDGDSTDIQALDNTETLTRYTDGEGVRISFIVQAPMTATAPLTVTYTNSKGVSGRVSTFNVSAGTSIGVCANGTHTAGGGAQASAFWPLAQGDTGVRSIESVQFGGSAGGFVCAALVKPLANIVTLESGVPVEKNFGFTNQPVRIYDGAYLNFMTQRVGTLAARLDSELVFANI